MSEKSREFGPNDYNAHYFGHESNGPISNYHRPYNAEGFKKTLRFGLWSTHIAIELWRSQGLRKMRVLDAGGATGMFAQSLKQLPGIEVYNIDLSSWARDNIVPNMKGYSVQGSLKTLPFKSDLFDGIVSFDVLEHIPSEDILVVAQEFHRVLKPNGRGIIVVNNGQFGDFEGDISHITKQPTKWWRSKFQLAGFKVVDPIFSFLRPSFQKVPRIAQKITLAHPGLVIIDRTS